METVETVQAYSLAGFVLSISAVMLTMAFHIGMLSWRRRPWKE